MFLLHSALIAFIAVICSFITIIMRLPSAALQQLLEWIIHPSLASYPRFKQLQVLSTGGGGGGADDEVRSRRGDNAGATATGSPSAVVRAATSALDAARRSPGSGGGSGTGSGSGGGSALLTSSGGVMRSSSGGGDGLRPAGGLFGAVVALVVSYVNYMVGTRPTTLAPGALHVLEILYAFSEKNDLLRFRDFYVGSLSSLNDDVLRSQYRYWVQKRAGMEGSSNTFCLLEFPFVLNGVAKTKLLHIESAEAMQREAQRAFFSAQSPYCVLPIRRAYLLEDALVQIRHNARALRRPLKVVFEGEAGVDEGGVAKEFFHLAVRELFKVDYGLFEEHTKARLMWFRPGAIQSNDDTAATLSSSETTRAPSISVRDVRAQRRTEMAAIERQGPAYVLWLLQQQTIASFFALAGVLVGLAVYNSAVLPLHFPVYLYSLLGRNEYSMERVRPTLADLRSVFPDVARSLSQLLAFEGDVENVFELNFTATQMHFGVAVTYDLLPNGASVPVTLRNRDHYVELYTQFLLIDSVYPELLAFRLGFLFVAGNDVLSLCRPAELERMVTGLDELPSIAEWRQSTRYDGGYTDQSPTIVNLWSLLEDTLTESEVRQFLAFSTGSERLPIGGVKSLRFLIQRNGPDSEQVCSLIISLLFLVYFSGFSFVILFNC